jgi:hypothetical protein
MDGLASSHGGSLVKGWDRAGMDVQAKQNSLDESTTVGSANQLLFGLFIHRDSLIRPAHDLSDRMSATVQRFCRA